MLTRELFFIKLHIYLIVLDDTNKKQIRLDGFLTQPSSKAFSKDLFCEALMKFVVKTDQPFTIVESTHFRSKVELKTEKRHCIG
jgi:hypothetical protein